MFLVLQVAFVTKRKNELEKRVEELLSERESLNNTLDDTSDKIILLERHAREQDCQVEKYLYLINASACISAKYD